MTGERGCHSEARFPLSVILRRASPSLSFRAAALPPPVILRSASPPLSVILRSFAPKNLSGHAPQTGEKILRFAQNDNGVG